MKRFWLATAAAALSVGTLVGVAPPASAQDPIIGQYDTREQCEVGRITYKAMFPMYDYYCWQGGMPGFPLWNLYREL